MINIWYNAWEIQGVWYADIYEDTDCLTCIGDVASKKEVIKLAEAFIRGFKFARGIVE